MITNVLAPQLNTNDDDVQIVAWHVQSGAYVESGQEIAELETSKTTMTLAADCAGYLDCLLPARATVRVGAVVCRIATSLEELNEQGSPHPGVAHEPAAAAAASEVAEDAGRGLYSAARFSRSAAQLLQTLGLSAEAFRGAGLVTAGRIRQKLGLRDAGRPALERTQSPGSAAAPAAPASGRCAGVSLAKKAEIIALSLGASGNINSTLSVRLDSAPLRLRLRQERLFDGNVQPLVLYEISRLLKEWPQFTAFYEEDAVHHYGRIDLGLAMDLGKGVKVVTIRNADQLTPLQIFEYTLDCGQRYLENRLRPEELLGSTLTITDLSGFDILQFQPLINGRQSAIIGLGGDQTLPGHPLTINMTFDHRVAAGREVALFLGELRSRLLSYAAPGSTAGQPLPTPQAAAAQRALHPLPRNEAPAAGVCDRCGIDMASYYSGFARDGYMLAFYRADGSLGGVCHRCFGSWN